MANRDERISLYVTEKRKNDLERRADAEDVSLSKYLNIIIERQMIMEAEDEVSDKTRATERLQRLIDQGESELRKVSNDIRDMNGKMGAYAIAAFELQAQNHEQAAIRDALRTGASRLQEDFDPSDIDSIADEAAGENDDTGSNSDPFAHRDL